ncbi:MAG: type IV pilus assembly protein PilM [Nitrospinales bacterium]|jgi:type IV pilus assembly protein PilM
MKLKLPSMGGDSKQKPGQKSIGLDIGFHEIKIVELFRTEKGFQITKFAIKEIPASILQQKDRAALLADLIKKMFADAKIKGRQVYLSITGHNVVIRNATLPKMPDAELADAAKWNAKEDVLFDLEKAVIDNYIMAESEKEGATFYEMLSVIVREDVIDFLVSIAKGAGLQPKGVTVVPIALWDYDAALNEIAPGTVTSYLDMGSERTRIYFVCDGQILFSREIPNGGKNLTASLVGEYELEDGKTAVVDAVRAEQIKKTFGFPAEDADGKTEEGIALSLIREKLEVILTKQITEMDRSIEYFKNQYRKDTVDRLILSGGGVGLSGLYQFLKENLDLEIDRCNPFFQADTEDESISKENMKLYGPSLTAAAGLALGQCDKINILPDKYRPTLKKTLAKLAPIAAVLLIVGSLYAYSSNLRQEIKTQTAALSKEKIELAVIQIQLPLLDKPIKELKNLRKERSKLKKEKKALPGSTSFPFKFYDVYTELALLVDNNTSLSEVTFEKQGGGEDKKSRRKKKKDKGLVKGERIKLVGHIFGNDFKTQSTLKFLLQDLRNSPVFKDIKLIRSEPLKLGDYNATGLQFELYVFPRTLS